MAGSYPDTINLSWSAVGEDGYTGNINGGRYRIKYSTDSSYGFNVNDYNIEITTDTIVGEKQSYILTELDGGVTYYVRVWTADGVINWSEISNGATAYAQGDITPPGVITTFTAVPKLQVGLSWTSPGDNGYDNTLTGQFEIKYTINSNDTPETASNQILITTTTKPGTQFSALLTSLQPRAKYYFWIRTKDEIGNWSIWSDTISVNADSFIDTNVGLTGICNGSLAWADYDNDGDIDLFAQGYSLVAIDKRVRVYRNDNSSMNYVQGLSQVSDSFNSTIDLGDYDLDGDLDLVKVGNNNGQELRLYRNDNGTFVLGQSIISGGGGSSSYKATVEFGDYDNEGDLDIVMTKGMDNGMSRIYRNDNNTFNWDTSQSLADIDESCVTFGDYDNDGDLDLVLCGSYAFPTTKIYRNDDRHFVDISEMNLVGICSGMMRWGDYDNDGDLDLAISGAVSDTENISKIYRNDSGSFFDINANLQEVFYCSIAWADYDNNAYIDLSISGYDYASSGNVGTIYSNNGSTFIDINAGLAKVNGSSLVWGDYDNDSDLDLGLAGYYYPPETTIIKIYKSLESEFGNINTGPSAPAVGFGFNYTPSTRKLKLTHGYGTDTETTEQEGLYYTVRVSSVTPISDTNAKIVSWRPATPFMGNYKHNLVSSAQPGVFLKSLKTDTSYYWQVRTIDTGLKNSGWSPEQSANTNHPPAAVKNLAVTRGGLAGEMNLTWTSPGDDDSTGTITGGMYRVRYSTYSEIDFTSSAGWTDFVNRYEITWSTTTNPLLAQSRLLTGLNDGSTYYFRLWTQDEIPGNWSEISNSASIMNQSPNLPVNLAQYSTSWKDIAFGSWINYQKIRASFTITDDDVSSTLQYNIQFSTYSDFSYLYVNSTNPVSATLSQGATNYYTPSLPEGSWFWRVNCTDNGGLTAGYSSATVVNGKNFGIDLTTPTVPVLSGPLEGFATNVLQISFDWADSNDILSGVSKYAVRASTSVNFSGTVKSSVTANSNAMLTLSQGKWYWTVRSSDTLGYYSNWASTWSVVIDTSPPAAVTNLAALTGSSEGEINLIWAAPGDDGYTGNITGGKYRIKYSTDSGYGYNLNDYEQEFSTNTVQGEPQNHTITGLMNGATYYVRIWSQDELNNWSSMSNGATAWAQVDLVLPSKITDLAALDEGGIKLSWTATGDNGLEGNITGGAYRVRYSTYVSEESDFWTDSYISWANVGNKYQVDWGTNTYAGATETYIVSNLREDVTYYVRIWIRDEVGSGSGWEGNWSEISNGATVYVSIGAPAAITDLAAMTGATEGRIDLSWTSPHENGLSGGKVSGYVIKYGTFSVSSLSGDTTGWWNNPLTITGLEITTGIKNPGETETAYIDTLLPGVTYYLGIRSYDEMNAWSDYDSGSYGVQSSTAAKDIIPITPTGFNVVSVSTYIVNLGWDNMSGQSGYIDFDYYRIYRASGNYIPEVISTVQVSGYSDSKVTSNTTYYYWILAVDKPPVILTSELTTGVTVYVPLPSIITDNVKPRRPSGIKLDMTNNKIGLKWSKVTKNENGTDFTDNGGYRIYRSDNLYANWENVGYVLGGRDDLCAWEDNTFSELRGAYYYKMRTLDSSGNESKDSMIYDTSQNMNIISISPDNMTVIWIPKLISSPLYRGAGLDDDVIIDIKFGTDASLPETAVMYEVNALKSSNDEKINNFKFTKPMAKISFKYDNSNKGIKRAKAAQELSIEKMSLFWFNGLEWTKISSIIEGNALTTLSSRLGKYMIKSSIRATSFVVTKVYPQIFTPDCDNRNDYVEFQYDNPLDGNPFGRIYDLKGALVSELKKGSNYNSFTWDGRTMAGDIARPGAYVYQIEITGSETKVINGVVILAK